MNLKFWKQTTNYTCGPSCFMTSGAEKRNTELSEEEELFIWKSIIPRLFENILKKHIGSPPIFLTKFIFRKKIKTSLFIYRNNYKQFGMDKKNIRKYKFGCKLHDSLCRILKGPVKIKRNKYVQTSKNIFDYISKSDNHYIIQNIIINNNIVHFVLIRNYKNKIAVMDPEIGENHFFSHDDFKKEFNNSLFGYSIHLNFN